MPHTLLRLDAHPLLAPGAWDALTAYGPDLTVVVNVAHGPGSGRDPSYTEATTALARAGVRLLGYVDLAFATRPAPELLADVGRWCGYPVSGVFLDRAPASPFAIGPVAVAVQAAQRAGLDRAVLNPGVPPDPTYRELGAAICAFEGTWTHYRRWDGSGARLGDGHLVYAVPPAELPEAHRLIAARGAGFRLVTDLGPPEPYAGLPAWCELALAR
jgi:hypothetical protein